MDGDGTLQVGQSRGVLVWTRCSETGRCGFHIINYTDEVRICVMGFNPVSDRIATIHLQCNPVNIIMAEMAVV